MNQAPLVDESRKLLVRLAENQSEVEETLALRYQIFNVEMGEGLAESTLTGKDRDEFDQYCDHLIVLDPLQPQGGQIIGTYRLLRRSVARKNIGFYSEREFNLNNLDHLQDEIAEMGRSCVHEDYRDGSALGMLWAGLAEYVKKYKIRYLMGCGSIHTTDPAEISLMYSWLKAKNHIVDEHLRVEPQEEFKMEAFTPDLEIENLREAKRSIPGLILSYLMAGAKIGGHPALDYEFNVTDFFLFFDSLEIEERYGKHYLEE